MDPDCIIKAIPEFMADPKLGYLQCATSPMPEQRSDYFQRMTSDFTFRIYHVAIAPDVARGHIAPLVGHNAFLSWKAMEECKFGTSNGNGDTLVNPQPVLPFSEQNKMFFGYFDPENIFS